LNLKKNGDSNLVIVFWSHNLQARKTNIKKSKNQVWMEWHKDYFSKNTNIIGMNPYPMNIKSWIESVRHHEDSCSLISQISSLENQRIQEYLTLTRNIILKSNFVKQKPNTS